ncbi:MAG TPA: phosphoglucosamine mutase [Candidatus Eremiobacteraceae bacterium]|nr:phosphoglucosamine mutase [Candidatus Eremiobacteraceae bacterium]
MNRLFGTDGVRGVANEFLTPELAFALGRAGASVLAAHGERRPILVGRDTRLSGPMLENALSAGVCSIGLDVWKLGIVPTPAVAFLTRQLEAAAGVMISASHNPIEDNGIKFFAADGCKLPDTLEDEIAGHVEAHHELPRPTGKQIGTIGDRTRDVAAYADHCVALGGDLSGLTVVVDGAYGSAYDLAPRILRRLGAGVIRLHCKDDGGRINVRCGATDLTSLRRAVARHPNSIGVAFDGDADRALFVDEGGEVVTGDHVLAIWAKELLDSDELPHKTIVATVMSNLGLELAIAAMGAKLVRTAVGDRYVLEAMQRGGFRIGGEQSGHIIDLEANTTGDGIATAVRLLSLAAKAGALRALRERMQTYPQILVNVRVDDKRCVERDGVRDAIAAAEKSMRGKGRILVRPSGTEPLIRIMIEGQDESEMRTIAQSIADRIVAAAPSIT